MPKTHEWRAPSGMRVRCRHAQHGPPFARSRAIFLYLTTKAVECGPTLTGRLADIANMFELPWPIDNIEKHFLRVVFSDSECTSDACGCFPMPCQGRVQIAHDIRYCPTSRGFRLTFSDQFLMAVRYGMRCPRPQVAELLRTRQLAALDLLIWFRWQEHRHTAASLDDAVGDRGPFRLITSAETPTRKRDEIVRLYDAVRAVWPDLRFDVTPDGRKLVYRSEHVQQPVESGCLVDIIFDELEPAQTIEDIRRLGALESFDDDDEDQGIGADAGFTLEDDEIAPKPRSPIRRKRKPPMTIPVRTGRPPTRRARWLPRFQSLPDHRLPRPDTPSIPRPRPRDHASPATGPPGRQLIAQPGRPAIRAIGDPDP